MTVANQTHPARRLASSRTNPLPSFLMEKMQTDFQLWQLIDSAFPAGGFAHSGGLEALWQSGHITDENLPTFLDELLKQNAAAFSPFMSAAFLSPEKFEEIDARCDAFITGHVAGRSSRAQGQAFLASSARAFSNEKISAIESQVRRDSLAAHLPVVFGIVCRHLNFSVEQSTRAFLFITLRGLISAAVRLGVVGPLRGQQIQMTFAPRLEALAEEAEKFDLESAAQINPLIELLSNTSDRLYSRLFQS
jgi:urease accessory protein